MPTIPISCIPPCCTPHKPLHYLLRQLIALLPLLIFLAVAVLHIRPTNPSLSPFSDSETPTNAILQLPNLVRAVSLSVPHAPRRVTVVTAVNFAFREFLINLNCSLRRTAVSSLPRLLVVTLDTEMDKEARRLGFHSVYMGSRGLPHAHEEAMFGTRGFNLLSKRKLYAVYHILKTGSDVLFTDADIVWCADVVDELSRMMYGERDIDGFGQRPARGLLMQTAWPRSILNSGFYYARASDKVVRLFEAFLAYGGDAENDQAIVNRVLCQSNGSGEVVYGQEPVVHTAAPTRRMPVGCRWQGGVAAGMLEARRFPTGGELMEGGDKLFHLPRRELMAMCDRREVALLHNNCILSGKKKARFVVKGIWYVDEQEGGCLQEPAAATREVRRRCGSSKCGEEGDVNRFPDLKVR